MIQWTDIAPFASLILSGFLPWVLSRKIHQDIEPMLDKALKARPSSDEVRALIDDNTKRTEESMRREYATKEALARLEARFDSLASKEAVAKLSSQIDGMDATLNRLLNLMEHRRA